MNLRDVHAALDKAGYPVLDTPAESQARFPDGAPWHIEIPSCEGPRVMHAIIDEATVRGIPVHRVSQGSGVMMLTDSEITEMVTLGKEYKIEVCLFLGPRGAWDIGGQAKVFAGVGGVARGGRAVAASLADAFRAVELGVTSLLVGDLGVLVLLDRFKKEGALPADLVLKTSVLMPLTNAPTAVAYERAGATCLNVSTDLELTMLSEIRSVTSLPIDLYIEVPDDQGGSVRFYEAPEIVRVTAPVHLKMGVRNAPNIYPVGLHLASTAEALGRERVRRAELVLGLLRRHQLHARAI